jgi:hypothetical protein
MEKLLASLHGNIYLGSKIMPWEIKQGTSQCSGYGVFKEGTSQLEGCHSTREAANKQMAALYASENKVIKQENLYDMLTEEEKAFHDALVGIAAQYGPFDLGTSSIWVGYETSEENEDAEIGVKCSNCTMFNTQNNGCAILSYSVEPEGKCRLAAIPDGLVVSKMDKEDEKGFVEEMLEDMNKKSPCWDGYVQRGTKPGKDGNPVPNCVPAKKTVWQGTAFQMFDK